MHILLTRPLEDCSEMILKFQSLGHQVSQLPLIRIEKVYYEKINFFIVNLFNSYKWKMRNLMS